MRIAFGFLLLIASAFGQGISIFPPPTDSGGDPEPPPVEEYVKAISTVTSVSIPLSEHGLSKAVIVLVFDENGAVVEPGDILINGGNDVSVTFAIPQTGNIVVRTFGEVYSGSSFTNQTSVAIDATNHQISKIVAVQCRDSDGYVVQTGDIDLTPSFASVSKPTPDVLIHFAVQQSGVCTIFGE